MIQPVSANSVVADCGSTNDLAKSLGEAGAPHGTWISARRQTAGRGRLGRSWMSEEGNLFLSLVLRGDFGPHRTWLPLVAALGVARALPGSVKIKWPNDLVVRSPEGLRKMGGLLCEAHGNPGSKDAFFVAGIGVNVRSSPEGLEIPTARLLDFDAKASVDSLREDVIHNVITCVSELAAAGPSLFRLEYEKRAAFPAGAEIEWTTGTVNHMGRVRGLGEFGELLVEEVSEAGKPRPTAIFAEDIRTKLKTY